MKTILGTIVAVIFSGALLLTMAGCEKTEGPAEHAGKQVDKAVDQAGQKIEKAGEKLQDAAEGNKK